jgi:hypothetical protein
LFLSLGNCYTAPNTIFLSCCTGYGAGMDELEAELDVLRAAHLDECNTADCAVCAAIWRAAREDAAEAWLLDHEAACPACLVCMDEGEHAVVPVD